MPDKFNANRLARGRNPVLELAILCAMALAALAFAAGLYVQAGVGLVSAVIAGLALFLVMAASQAAMSRAHRFSEIVDRIDELQDSIERFNDEVDRIDRFASRAQRWDDVLDRVSELDKVPETCERVDRLTVRIAALDDLAGKVERIDPLSERVAALERLAEQVERIGPLSERVAALDRLAGKAERIDPLSERVAQLDLAVRPLEGLDLAAIGENEALVRRLGANVERLDARLEALRSQIQIEGKERQEKLTSELQMLETLLKQLAEQFAVAGGEAGFRASPAGAGPPPQPREEAREPEPPAAPETPAVAAPVLDGDHLDGLILERVRQSIEANKIDLYLQPIVALPQRRPRFYEVLTRLRNEAGELILPKDYIHVAESGGIMPLVDNMMLFRSVQVLRRLSERSSARGLFCNISVHSLLDAEFFAEFTAFMDQNRGLADSLFFEFSQAMIESCGPIEHESLGALASMGFRFSLDQVEHLNIDFQSLHEMGFGFVKVPAQMFLYGMAEAGARIHQADMRSYLDRYGIQLIVEKIEDESSLANVLDYDVKLAQGYLFSEPRPVRPEVFAGKDSAAAA